MNDDLMLAVDLPATAIPDHTLAPDIVILAAGESTRMRSKTPKVLHPLAGRPLIEYSVRLAESLSPRLPTVVVGRNAEALQAQIGDRAGYVHQQQRLGTGHAVLQARPLLLGHSHTVLVFYADMPLVTLASMQALLALHQRNQASGGVLTLLTFESDTPRGFGRIVRSAAGQVLAIVEEADCTAEQLEITELNPGLYCYDADWLWRSLDEITVSPKGEYYLTDLVAIAVQQGCPVLAHRVSHPVEMMGINTRVHLAEAEAVLRARINRRWMEAGVTIVDPATTYIEDTVEIGRDTLLLPGVHLRGQSKIGEDCCIGPDTTIIDTTIGAACRVQYAVLEDTLLEDQVDVGPFAHLRARAHLATGVHMGNFGEVKNSYLGPGAKMGHFSYVGDADIGQEVNVSAGVITCNYDGVRKNRTTVGDYAFIGSDTMLVAPVTIGAGARTGAGSVVTHDVPPGRLAVGVPARLRPPSEAQGE
ncbi:MAG: bifunctional UDP-N-acetylglucosamine diphosphorylase/glucosamine-1-phosphate N-acetyltransferase GlmU [Anaerolineae bacterium]